MKLLIGLVGAIFLFGKSGPNSGASASRTPTTPPFNIIDRGVSIPPRSASTGGLPANVPARASGGSGGGPPAYTTSFTVPLPWSSPGNRPLRNVVPSQDTETQQWRVNTSGGYYPNRAVDHLSYQPGRK